MALTVKQPGDSYAAVVTFTNVATGLPYDPSAVKFHYRDPAGTAFTKVYGVDTAVVSKLSTGVYQLVIYIPYDRAAIGLWSVDAQALDGSNNSQDISHITFTVVMIGTL